jgi:hypothetical protein
MDVDVVGELETIDAWKSYDGRLDLFEAQNTVPLSLKLWLLFTSIKTTLVEQAMT